MKKTMLIWLILLSLNVHANYYENFIFPDSTLRSNEPIKNRMGVSGGYSKVVGLNPANYPYGQKERIRQLGQGMLFSFDFWHFKSSGFGMGMKHSIYRSNSDPSKVVVMDPVNGPITITYEDKMKIQCTGPVFIQKIISENSLSSFFINLSFCYVFYSNNTYINHGSTPLNERGETLGILGGIGYDISLTNHLFLDISCAYKRAKISKVKINNLEYQLDETLNLSSFDFLVGLKFCF
jgi:hypothetical protein